MLQYKYVFFDAGRSKNHNKVDTEDYFYISTSELRNNDRIIMVAYPLDYACRAIRFGYSITAKISSRIKLLKILNRLWYPFYYHGDVKKDEKVCFLVYGYYIKPDYIKYLKRKYKKCKVIKIHRDSYDKWRKRNPEYTDQDMKILFDAQFSFDLGDSKRYNMVHFEDFCSKVSNLKIETKPIHDVFFAGAAKDRMDLLIKIYDYLSSMGQNCYFYITNCKKDQIVQRKGIEYASEPMSYRQMLYNTINSRIILEVNQKGVDGYTSRFLESVMYNKKLITNNMLIKESVYYHPEYVLCISKPEDINKEFLCSNVNVDFGYKDDFSPIRFMEKVDAYLANV